MTTSSYRALMRAPRRNAPIIFAFHGTGGDEYQFADLARQILPDAGLISPRGDVSEFGALRFFRRTSEGSYDMQDLARRTDKMVEFIASHKAENPGRAIYGFGYSNGANILASVLFTQPQLFDRAALLHPLIPWIPADNKQLKDRRILITAGQRDPISPLPLTERLVDYFAAQRARVEACYHSGGHEIRPEELQALQSFLT
ncbi:phospholipase/carboxylesterase family protein (plasmid) [Sinorhizobium fredii NGR234]|uniref:Phospholipase/carboxylesterase family protein n=1 Tax=Sinorhizobium fredii (strain NBRC 101917 / NGR234) TaxID=394 RepID=C3KKW4_SINFN|nr:alpha/beta hydrolase [Sinorhizobium fredii]ACP23050.1 phospholipase/carboxylesterase family protein [Sinorhizobium fredii NGR234]